MRGTLCTYLSERNDPTSLIRPPSPSPCPPPKAVVCWLTNRLSRASRDGHALDSAMDVRIRGAARGRSRPACLRKNLHPNFYEPVSFLFLGGGGGRTSGQIGPIRSKLPALAASNCTSSVLLLPAMWPALYDNSRALGPYDFPLLLLPCSTQLPVPGVAAGPMTWSFMRRPLPLSSVRQQQRQQHQINREAYCC